jgi:alkaline phosphatase D
LSGSASFSHGVASGDPTADRVVIWTRVSTDRDTVPVEWIVAHHRGLEEVVGSGQANAEAERDHTVAVDVEGLTLGDTHYYGFRCNRDSSPAARSPTSRAGTTS